MRSLTALSAAMVTVGVAVLAGTAAWFLSDGGDRGDGGAPGSEVVPAESPSAKVAHAGTRSVPRVRASEEPPAVDVASDLERTWATALAQHKDGKPVEALTTIAPGRRDRPDWFAEASRAPVVRAMERAAVNLLARAARVGTLAEARALANSLLALVKDPALLAEIRDLLAAAERRAAAVDPALGAQVLANATAAADREALARHLQRFAGVGPAPKKKDWIDEQLGRVEAAGRTLTNEPDPLALPDPLEAEKRRLDQLEKLRQRDAAGLLDPIDGALAWLALHQADDGHFGEDAAAARCKVMAHDPPCVAGTKERAPLAATGLAVLAFLDFRDQDVRRLFEPTLARGISWIAGQQQPDGSFKPPGRASYQASIGLMALGQAAASTRDPKLKEAVARGIAFYSKHPGPSGGYGYNLDQDGDLSVTGWYVQAVEAAGNAGVALPDDMRQGLERFLNAVSVGPPQWKYAYRVGQRESWSLAPVGMLVSSILRPQSPQWYGEDWRAQLAKGPPANSLYSLYYGVRVLLFLDGQVGPQWRTHLTNLAKKQTVQGSAAGVIDVSDDRFFKDWGRTTSTAFAALTLEHSLYRR
jgi:hypothetical protein